MITGQVATGLHPVPDGPLAGYLPVTGIFGLSWMVALTAAVLAWLFWLRQTGNTRPQRRPIALTVLLVAALWSGGVALKQREWTHPGRQTADRVTGARAIPQSLKWDPDAFGLTLRVYAEQVAAARGRLIILPETAFPLMYDEMPAQYVNALRDTAPPREPSCSPARPPGWRTAAISTAWSASPDANSATARTTWYRSANSSCCRG